MADVAYIVEALNAAPFNMKLMSHKFSDLKGLPLLQKVNARRSFLVQGDLQHQPVQTRRSTMFSGTLSPMPRLWMSKPR